MTERMDGVRQRLVGSASNGRPGAARVPLLAIAAALLAAMLFHEIGHDEAQAWNLARASSYPWEVVANGRVEGHTPLWHIVLWPLTLGGNPFLMQLLGVLLALAAAALLLRDRPFPLWVCALIAVGYFPFYQYGIIPRPYTLALLLSALLGSALYRGRGSFAARASLCGLLAFTSAFGVAMSVGLMFLVLAEALPRRPTPRSLLAPHLVGGLALYAALAALGTSLVLFPLGSTALENAIASGGRIGSTGFLHVVESAVFPQFDRLPLGIGAWLGTSVPGRVLVALAAYGVVIAFALWLWPRPAAVIAWLLAVLGVGFAGMYSGFVAERYAGHLFLAALAIGWAAPGLRGAEGALSTRFFERLPRPGERAWRGIRRLAAVAFVGVLAFHAALNAAASALDIGEAQSPWRQIAADLERTMDEPYRLVATYGYDAGPLTAYLDEPHYDLRCRCWTRFTEWDRERMLGPAEEIEANVCALAREHGTLVVVVTRKAWWAQGRLPMIGEYAPGFRDSGDFPVRVFRTSSDPDAPDACTAPDAPLVAPLEEPLGKPLVASPEG